MNDYEALVRDARDHVEHIARGIPGTQADRVRRGENDDPRTSLVVRLADAVEALVAEKANVHANLTRALDIAQEANDDCYKWSQMHTTAARELDEALKALGEARAANGDSEARRAELEAVIEKAKRHLKTILGSGAARLNATHRILDSAPSVVLEDRGRENRAIGWDEARERFNDDNYRQGCVCLNADHRREHPAMHWLNPYRGDNR